MKVTACASCECECGSSCSTLSSATAFTSSSAARPAGRPNPNGSMSGMSAGVGERFEKLVEIMRALRAPDGCPWDREQTHASLRPFLLEETYEALEAIDSGSPMHLCEELGDVLFEVVFMSRISEEAGEFTIADTIDAISDKLVRRHPHVFARQTGDSPLTSNQVIEKWETLKARERAEAGKTPK